MAAATSPFVQWLEECDVSSATTVGGKGAGLGELLRAGVSIPPGFVVTTAAHREFLAVNALAEREAKLVASIDFDDVGSVALASKEIRRLTEGATIPEEVAQSIVEGYVQLSARCGTEEVPVAVRSSASGEDLAVASFAGQLQTFLWIVGGEELLVHVRRCWAGLFRPEALAYRHRAGLDGETALMAVCIQQMVDAQAAGVMFTLNPLNGDRSKIAIEASWGLGEALVGGEVNPDRFLIDKVTLEILDRSIGGKEVEYRFDPKRRELVRREVKPKRQQVQSIGDDVAVELARQGKWIESHYGRPVDVEWAIDRLTGRVHALQSRPETVWSQREARPVTERRASALEHVLTGFLRPPGTGAKEA